MLRWFAIPLVAPAVFAAAARQLSTLPLAFEPNEGQANAQVRFLAHSPHATVWFTQREAVYGDLRVRFEGAAAAPRMEGQDRQTGISNYFSGNDRKRWRTNIPRFGKVVYHDLYPGIDAVFYGNSGQLEYDFVLKPGADPAHIRLVFGGADATRIDASGDLVLTVGPDEFRNRRPVITQNGKRVGGHWQLTGSHRAGFALDPYDRNQPLTIDPILTYATFLGGANPDAATAIAMDSQGNLVIAGETASSDFPTAAPLYSVSSRGAIPVVPFIAKLNPLATGADALIYATYFDTGGVLQKGATVTAVAVDHSGNAYFTGAAYDNLPLQNPLQSTFHISYQCSLPGVIFVGLCQHAYVAEISAAGNQLLFSSYLEGSSYDAGTAIAVDAAGNIFVGGQTKSPDFPVTGNAVLSGTKNLDGFVTEISAARTLAYSTIFGSPTAQANDSVNGIAVDSAGLVYIGGVSESTGLPVSPGAYNSTPVNPSQGYAFAAILNPANQAPKSSLVYSTYVGPGAGTAVAADSSGNIYLAGIAQAAFPVTSSAIHGPSTNPNYTSAFVLRLNPSMSGSAQLSYSTCFGSDFSHVTTSASLVDLPHALAVDPSGKIVATGSTNSPYFVTTPNAIEPFVPNNAPNMPDFGFLVQIDPTQPASSALVYSTYLGGPTGTEIYGLALDSTGKIAAVAGQATGAGSPVTPSTFQSYGGGGDAYILRFDLSQTGSAAVNFWSNGASLSANANGVFSPGMIFTLKGTGLGPTAGTGGAIDPVSNKVSTQVSGVQVFVDGVPCPLLYLSATQINAIAPYEIASKAGQYAAVQVFYNGAASNISFVPVKATNPGIFSFDDGTGQAAVLNQDSSVNGPSNPAARGSVIQVFATGEGQTAPPGVDGALATEPLAGIPTPAGKVSLTIGGIPASIYFAGTAPGGVAGAFQVDAFIPDGAPVGSAVPIVLNVGGTNSQAGLTIAVQ